mmetsp:Transcript_28572/g.93113  ORF Transcript_28572/g.93113 Transcript_28572/m.93113 type:complete len:246 (+) Transcript_28572:237-974(+)
MRTMADAGQRHDALHGGEPLERAHASGRRPRVLLAVQHEHGRLESRVGQLLLGERAGRVGERVEDDVCAARLEERREQHIDELVRHHVRVEVRLLEDLLHRRRPGERVEERLASLAQRALHRLDDRHEEGAQEGWLLAHVQLSKVWVDDRHAVDPCGRVDGGLQRADRPDRVCDEGDGLVAADDLRLKVEELLAPGVKVVRAARDRVSQLHLHPLARAAAGCAKVSDRRAEAPAVLAAHSLRRFA